MCNPRPGVRVAATLGDPGLRDHLGFMRALIVIAACLLAAPAAAQIAPYPGPYVQGQNATGERHRYEMDRLRIQSDQRTAFARQQQLNSRLTVLELQAARRPAPVQPEAYRPLRTPEQERAAREAATTRRETTVEGVTQIDDWLDRSAD